MRKKSAQVQMSEETRSIINKIQKYYDYKGHDPVSTSEVIRVCVNSFMATIGSEFDSLERKFKEFQDKLDKKLIRLGVKNED